MKSLMWIRSIWSRTLKELKMLMERIMMIKVSAKIRNQNRRKIRNLKREEIKIAKPSLLKRRRSEYFIFS